MKKLLFNLAFLLLPAAFALADGVDVTSKLWNADCELGINGWEVTFTTDDNSSGYIWKASRHTEGVFGDCGYFGFAGRTLEIWAGRNFVGENSISQTVSGLENGTYVFGAYTVACYETEDAVPNIDEVEGAYIFAGNDEKDIATEFPGHFSKGGDAFHTRKINIATTITEGKLRVGFGARANSNITFLSFDNATLYYYGDVSTDAALQGMAQVDLQKSVAIADTLLGYKMNVDSLANLRYAIAEAANATTVEECEEADVAIRLNAIRARRSIYYYAALADIISQAKEVAAGEWSEDAQSALEELNALIEGAETAYADGELDNSQIDVFCGELEEQMNVVKCDEVFDMIDVLSNFIDYPEDFLSSEDGRETLGLPADFTYDGFGPDPGQIPLSSYDALAFLLTEAQEALDDLGEGRTAAEVRMYIEKIRNAVAQAAASINKDATLPMNIITVANPDGTPFCLVSEDPKSKLEALGYVMESECTPGVTVFRYDSPMISLSNQVGRLRFTVFQTDFTEKGNKCYPYGRANSGGSDGPYWNIAEFYLYDSDGNQISLDPNDITCNAWCEGSINGLVDGVVDNNSNFLHSCWNGSTHVDGNHYFEIAMPEGLTTFSFAYEVYWDNYYRRINIPTGITLSGSSQLKTDLEKALNDMTAEKPLEGTDPGFYDVDLSGYYNTIDYVSSLVSGEGTSDEVYEKAFEMLDEQAIKLETIEMNMPKPGVEYCITSAIPNFFNVQVLVKNMCVLNDSVLWWKSADASDKTQFFTFEPVPNNEGEHTFLIKNVGTGKYLPKMNVFNEEAKGIDYDYNTRRVLFNLDIEPDTFTLRYLGKGQMGFICHDINGATCMLHLCDHNNGLIASGTQEGGFHDAPGHYGDQSCIVHWNTGKDEASAWYIRPMNALPMEIDVKEGAVFRSDVLHFFTAKNVLTFAANKPCAFGNLKLVDKFGSPIDFIITNTTQSTVTLSFTNYLETLRISFDNPEGISSLTISGGVTKLSDLQKLYDEISAVEYVVGSDVGCVTAESFDVYKKALRDAEKLLSSGGTDEEIEASIASLKQAQESLVTVMPNTDKTYFIVNALPEFKDNFGVEMAIYEDTRNGVAAWTYLSVNNPAFLWQFVEADEGVYYIKNIATGNYMSLRNENSDVMMLPSAGQNECYTLVARGELKFNILNVAPDFSDSDMLHARNHNQGGNAFGSICYYRNETPSKSEWFIRDASSTQTSIDVIPAEPLPTRLQQEGIYDLMGRRVVNPENGIYIMGGRKIVIK